HDGVVTRMDARAVGVCAWRLGAGRAVASDTVQAAAGVLLHAKPGEDVRAGQPLMTLHTDDAARIPRAVQAVENAIDVDVHGAVQTGSVVLGRVDVGDLR